MDKLDLILEKLEQLEPMQRDINRLKILLEHDIPKQVQLLAEGHTQIIKRLPEAEEIDVLRSRLRMLESVVTEHSKDISELKKAL